MKRRGINIGQHVLSVLFLIVTGVMLVPMLSSCGKDSPASPTGLNTQLNIINVGPDRFPVDFYINLRKQNKVSYTYSIPSGYFYLASQDIPIQLRTQLNQIVFNKDSALAVNCKYTVFVTGLVSEKTNTTIFVTDTDTAPTLGRTKVRFINASAKAVNLDIYANGTLAFPSRGFISVSKYLEIPAGIYDFKICPAGTQAVLADLPNTTVQEGRLYTLYTRGVVGRTDSAAFAASLLTNR